jgi:hypothetical protein
MTTEPEVLQGEPLSAEENYYLDWVDDAPRLNQALLTDVLGKLLTLAVALAGGAAAFLRAELIAPGFHVTAAGLFLAAAAFALHGVYPREYRVAYAVEAIKDHKRALLRAKRRDLLMAAGCVGAGIFAAVLGLLLKALA